MKKTIFLLLVFSLYHIATMAQSSGFYGIVNLGGNVAVGNYGDVVMRDGDLIGWGLQDKTKFGGAGTGVNLGGALAFRMPDIDELSFFVSADLFFNPLNKTMRNYRDRLDVEWTNACDKYEQRFPVYFNLPVMLGGRYEFFTPSRDISVFAEGAFGTNLRFITQHYVRWNMYGHSSERYSFEEHFKPQFSYVFNVGVGGVFFERLQVGIHYYYFGGEKVISDVHHEYHPPVGELEVEDFENSYGTIAPSMITLRVGYIIY